MSALRSRASLVGARTPRAIAALVSTLYLGLVATAQHTLPTGPPALLWVDNTGSNTTGTGTVGNPWRTLTHAIVQANTGPGFTIIMVKPGVYDDAATDYTDPNPDQPFGEKFPLVMKTNVSLQGAGALDTIIRSVDGKPVLIEFHAAIAGAFDRVFIDGFNIHNEFFGTFTPQTGILISNTATERFPANPTISNCFITDHNTVGIDIVSAPGGDPNFDLDGAFTGFIPHRPRIEFCTFRFNQIGVRNRTSQAVGGSIVGANQPGLLNCLFVDQSFLFQPTDDLQGVDSDDLTISGVRSNAFERHDTEVGGPQLWNATPTPASAVVLANTKSEMANLTGTTPGPLFVDTFAFNNAFNDDLRLNPLLRDIASTLIDVGLDPGSQWTWDNTTPGDRLDQYGSGAPFDWDCEGYGNPRITDYTFPIGGPRPDIGADEVGYLVIGGFDGNRFSKDFANSSTPNMFYWFNGSGSVTEGHNAIANVADPMLYFTYMSGKVPSMRPKGTTVPTLLGGTFVGVGYLDSTAVFTTFSISAFPMQLLPVPFSGLHNEQAGLHDMPLGGQTLLSNLQTYSL